jgi:hypothetical protein
MMLIARLFVIALMLALFIAFPPLFFIWVGMMGLSALFNVLADRMGY